VEPLQQYSKSQIFGLLEFKNAKEVINSLNK
jgi:hypothetical protein